MRVTRKTGPYTCTDCMKETHHDAVHRCGKADYYGEEMPRRVELHEGLRAGWDLETRERYFFDGSSLRIATWTWQR